MHKQKQTTKKKGRQSIAATQIEKQAGSAGMMWSWLKNGATTSKQSQQSTQTAAEDAPTDACKATVADHSIRGAQRATLAAPAQGEVKSLNNRPATIVDMLKNFTRKRQTAQQEDTPLCNTIQSDAGSTHDKVQADERQQQNQQEAAQSQRNTQQSASTACKRAKSTKQQSAQCADFTVLTHNLMGITTVLEETAQIASEHMPDVMVYTETKLTAERRNQLDKQLTQYQLYHSCKAGMAKTSKSGKERSRAGSAGVTIAIHTKFITQNSVSLIRINNPIAKGHCKAIKIQPPGSDCIIV